MNGWLQFNAHETNEPERLQSMGKILAHPKENSNKLRFYCFFFFFLWKISPCLGRMPKTPSQKRWPSRFFNLIVEWFSNEMSKSIESILAASNSTREKVLNILYPVTRSLPTKLNAFASSISKTAYSGSSTNEWYFCSLKIHDFGWASQTLNFLFIFFGTTKRLIISCNCELIYSRPSTVRHTDKLWCDAMRYAGVPCVILLTQTLMMIESVQMQHHLHLPLRECTIRKMN